jgi:hypothetical protein
MIYTDGIHIISDAGVQELHWFAERAGIGRWWFENKRNKKHPHYDKPKFITTNQLITRGAHYVTSKHLVRILKQIKNATLLP